MLPRQVRCRERQAPLYHERNAVTQISGEYIIGLKSAHAERKLRRKEASREAVAYIAADKLAFVFSLSRENLIKREKFPYGVRRTSALFLGICNGNGTRGIRLGNIASLIRESAFPVMRIYGVSRTADKRLALALGRGSAYQSECIRRFRGGNRADKRIQLDYLIRERVAGKHDIALGEQGSHIFGQLFVIVIFIGVAYIHKYAEKHIKHEEHGYGKALEIFPFHLLSSSLFSAAKRENHMPAAKFSSSKA